MKFKNLLFTLSCLILLPFAASCHGKKEIHEFIVPEEFDNSENYEISFWAKNDTNMIQKRIYEQAIVDFESLYPNIKVNMRQFSDYGQIYKDVLINIKTNTTPNVCISYPDHVATYLSNENLVVPLDNLISNEKYGLGGSKVLFDSPKESEVFPKFMQECFYNKNQYLLPFMRSTEACYINQDYVEKLGFKVPEVLTWDFMWEVASKALDEYTGEQVLLPIIYKSVDNQLITMLKQKNIPYTTANGEIDLFSDGTKLVLKDLGYHTATGEFEIFAVTSYPGNYFNVGRTIFAIDSTAGATWMGENAPQIEIEESKIAHFKTVVRPVPQYDVNNQFMISQGPSICVFNKDDPQVVMASWLFASFLLNNSVQIPYSETEGYLPVTSKAFDSPDYQAYLNSAGKENYDDWDDSYISAKKYYNGKSRNLSAASFFYDTKIDATKLVYDNINNTFITPVFNGSTAVRNAAGYLIEMTIKEVNKHANDINGDNYEDYISDDFIKSLYDSTINRYKLDVVESKLSSTAIIMLILLSLAWVYIAGYGLTIVLKNHKKKKKRL